MTPDEVEAIRERAKEPLHQVFHDLDVRITGLNREGCHCNLVAEVALDALAPTFAALAEAQRERDEERERHTATLQRAAKAEVQAIQQSDRAERAVRELANYMEQLLAAKQRADTAVYFRQEAEASVELMRPVVEAAREAVAKYGAMLPRFLAAAVDTYETQTGGTE